jgi:hypothetical protein
MNLNNVMFEQFADHFRGIHRMPFKIKRGTHKLFQRVTGWTWKLLHLRRSILPQKSPGSLLQGGLMVTREPLECTSQGTSTPTSTPKNPWSVAQIM